MQAIFARFPALSFPIYRRYWFASFASVGATQLITLGQGWLIFELTGSPLQLGVLGAAAALPNICMTLLGGVIADRFNKRHILMSTSAAITVLLTLLAVLDYSGQVRAWQVMTIAGLFSLITGLDWPTRVAIYPHFVSREAMMNAVALNSFIWQSTRMAIPALGGLIIYWADTWLIFAMGAAGFATMFVVISGIRVSIPNSETGGSPLQQIGDGLRFILHNGIFKWLIGLTFVGMFFAQSYVQILPVFVGQMSMGEQGYGYLLSAGGLGSVIGTMIVGSIRAPEQQGRMMFAGALLTVLFLAGFVGSTQQIWISGALVCIFLAAASSSFFLIVSTTTLQMRVPDGLRGRVMGIHTIGYSLIPLGGLFLGWLAESYGAGEAVLLGCGVYLTCSLVTWFRKADLRHLS